MQKRLSSPPHLERRGGLSCLGTHRLLITYGCVCWASQSVLVKPKRKEREKDETQTSGEEGEAQGYLDLCVAPRSYKAVLVTPQLSGPRGTVADASSNSRRGGKPASRVYVPKRDLFPFQTLFPPSSPSQCLLLPYFRCY